MAYVAITSGEIESGKPTTTTFAGKVKDNFADHETRIGGLEAGSNIDYQCIILRVNGRYSHLSTPYTGLLKTTINFNMVVVGARLIIDGAGTSGTTEVDVKYSRSGGSYTSIFDTLPSVAFGEGNDAISSNAVLDATDKNLQAGDIIRLDITSTQVGGNSFTVRIDYTKGE